MKNRFRNGALRLLAIVGCALVGFGGLPLMSSIGDEPAAAAFGAGQPARYNKNVNGDFLLIGNTVLKCTGSNCTESGRTNDYIEMTNSDPDGAGALFNGSSGTFTIPAGSVVDAAYLYWGGNLGTTRGSGGNTTYYCADDHDSVSNATANKSNADKVKLKIGAGAYNQVTADTVYTDPAGGLSQSLPAGNDDDGLVYEGVADVTAAFASVAAATATTVSVADIQTMQGGNCHAGWSLTVVYRFPTLNCLTGADDNTGQNPNRRNDYRNVAIYDGLLRQKNGAADTTTTLSGFLTAQPGPNDLRLGALAWEGDQELTGDQMKVKSNLSGSPTTVDPAGPAGTTNFFDSGKQPTANHNADLDTDPDSSATIQRGYTGGRNDGHGIDAKTQIVSVPGGTSSIDVTFTTTSDNYYPGQFALSSPLKCLLIIEKDQAVNGTSVPRDNATSPAPYVKAGDVLTYTMPVRVSGDVDLTDVVVKDVIPAGTTYVAGSSKIGKGNTAAAAIGALAAGGSVSLGTLTANVGTLNNLSGNTCPAGDTCYAAVQFQVTVNAGVTPGTVITNQATSTFKASNIAINEISNPVTDKVGALLTISKTITGAIPGDPTTFTFTVICNGTQVAGSPVSLASGGSATLGVVPGASCTVTEATNANFAVSVSGAIVTNGGSTTMTEDRSVSFTNTRLFGKIKVNKAITPVPGDPTPVPTFQFTVTCPGVAGYPKTLTITGSGSGETPSDIPFGTNCTVTEAPAPGWAQSGSQSVQPVNEATENVSFTNTRQTGALIITKTTVGGDGTFNFNVACDGTAWDVTRTITTAGGTGQSTHVIAIPAGVNCTVTEDAQVGWTQTSGPAGPLTIAPGEVATAAFTNIRQTADLVITKAVSGTYAIPVSGTFPYVVNCGAAGTFTPSINASNSANGTATVSGIPVGTSCTVTETIPAGWSLDGSINGNTNGRQITIAQQGNSMTFTNRRDVGSITITKNIDQGSGTFRFDLTCNSVPVAGSPFDITINAPAVTGSVTVPNIPTGSNCTVDENPNGSTSGDFVQVTPSNNGVVNFTSTAATQTATFVNHRKVGSLVIRKVFPQGSLGDPNQQFTFTWDCGPEPRTVTLKAGEQHVVSGIPTGTGCTVSETANASYETTYSPQNGAVTIAQGENVVTVTNVRKTGTLELRKQLVPAADPGRFDLDVDGGAAEATGVGDGGTTGSITVPIGAHSIAEAVAAGNGADLGDYTTTIACIDTAGEDEVPVTQDNNVVVNSGAKVVCTFTNTRKTGNLTLTKVVVDPLQSGHTFDLKAGTTTVVDNATNGSTGTTPVNTGSVTVSETGTNLGDYTTTIACTTNGQPSATGVGTSLAVAVTPNANVSCTFTNTRKTGTIEVRKHLSPTSDPGTFDLHIDDTVKKAAATHNGTTGPVTVTPGNHTIAETAATGTDMGDYTTSLTCIDTSEDEPVTVTNGTVNVPAGTNVLCTFTNTRKTGNLTLTKVVVDPLQSGHTFDLKAGTTTVVDNATNGSTDSIVINSGPVTVSETSTNLADYTTTIVCDDDGEPLAQGTDTSLAIVVPANGDVTCTFTNTRKTGTIEVRKHLSPTSDPGTFDLHIDDTVKKAAATHNGTTGPVTVTPGNHTIAETAATGTDMGDYTTSLTCIDTSEDEPVTVTNGTVNVPAGTNVLCTFTNTRKTGNLTLTKVVVDPLQSGHTFDLKAGTTTVVDNATNGSVGSISVNTGSVTVSETSTNLADYTTAIICLDGDDNVGTINNGTSLKINVTKDAEVTCTFTNTRKTGTIEVRKHLSPTSDPGTFDLHIDDTVKKAAATHNGTTGPVTVTPGNHTIAETAATGTDMGDYTTSLTCIDTSEDEPVTVTNGTVNVPAGTNVLCTFTNTRKTGNLTLTKVVVDPLQSGHTFDLKAGTTTVVDNATNGSVGSISVNTGSVTVSETSTNLADYTTTIVCDDDGEPLAQGTDTSLAIVVPANGDVTCTFTNTRKTGTIEVRKHLSPTSDPGTFDLHIDDTVKKAAATHNGTTGPVTVTPGNHTIAETAAGSTLGGEYDSSVVCVSDTREDDEVLEVIEGEVTVEVGDNVVCTFTNTRKPADLTIVKNPGSEFVLPGGTASFSITVSNAAGGGTAHDVVVSDPVPTGVTYVSSQDGVCGEAGTSCELGDIAPGASVTFTINYLVGSDPDLMVVHNAATVTSPDDPESPGDDADIPVARMSIVKTGTPSSYSAEGDVLTYTYVVSNTGGATLTGVTVIDDRIPTESIDCNDEGEGNGQPLTLAVEESVSCVATYAVKAADMTADSVDNVGTADSDQTGTVFDTWSIPRAALSIEKVATSKGPFALGDTINYEITVTNVGTASLHGVTITEAGEGATLDDECPAAPTGEGVILHKGESVTCTATHTVTQADFDAGSYTNVATADSDETPPVDGDETVTTPDPAVDLAIVKSLSSPSIVAGQQATYTLTVSNNGPATATSVKVTDKMPAGLTATAAAGLGWSCKIENNTVECSTAAVVAAKAQLPPITITASVSADARGNIVNTATVGGTQVDRDPSNNTSTVTNPITVVLAATVEATTTTTIAQRAPVTVAAAPTRVAQRTGTPLATTGTTSSLLLIVAGSLMVIGSVALGVRRRRLR